MSEQSGGRVNYYLCRVEHPSRENQPAYTAECEDLIRYLGLDFFEANDFKAIWRTAMARKGEVKPGKSQQEQALYDAGKRVHYAQQSLRILKEDMADRGVKEQVSPQQPFQKNGGGLLREPVVLGQPAAQQTAGDECVVDHKRDYWKRRWPDALDFRKRGHDGDAPVQNSGITLAENQRIAEYWKNRDDTHPYRFGNLPDGFTAWHGQGDCRDVAQPMAFVTVVTRNMVTLHGKAREFRWKWLMHDTADDVVAYKLH